MQIANTRPDSSKDLGAR